MNKAAVCLIAIGGIATGIAGAKYLGMLEKTDNSSDSIISSDERIERIGRLEDLIKESMNTNTSYSIHSDMELMLSEEGEVCDMKPHYAIDCSNGLTVTFEYSKTIFDEIRHGTNSRYLVFESRNDSKTQIMLHSKKGAIEDIVIVVYDQSNNMGYNVLNRDALVEKDPIKNRTFASYQRAYDYFAKKRNELLEGIKNKIKENPEEMRKMKQDLDNLRKSIEKMNNQHNGGKKITC